MPAAIAFPGRMDWRRTRPWCEAPLRTRLILPTRHLLARNVALAALIRVPRSFGTTHWPLAPAALPGPVVEASSVPEPELESDVEPEPSVEDELSAAVP